MQEFKTLQTILEVCSRLHARNLLAAADGNVSYRFSDNQVAITPTGVPSPVARAPAAAFPCCA